MLGAKPTPGLQRGRPHAPPLSINTDTPASLGAVKQIPPRWQLEEEQTDISKEQQSPVRGSSWLACFTSLQKVTYPGSDVAGDSRGQEGFTFHH